MALSTPSQTMTFTSPVSSSIVMKVVLSAVPGLWLAVHWRPAQSLFGTADLTLHQWILATVVASLVLRGASS
jgi:hypothetical protein